MNYVHRNHMKKILIDSLNSNINTTNNILGDDKLIAATTDVALAIIKAFRHDNKVLFCGNGGSAADAQHLAAELSGRFYIDRPPLFAEALHVNTSYLTAVANDYSFDEVFSRLVKAKGRAGDILVGISTSGKSNNIINALMTAKDVGIVTVGFCGAYSYVMRNFCKYVISIPAEDTPRIQEAHILIGHIICEIVERDLFGDGKASNFSR